VFKGNSSQEYYLDKGKLTVENESGAYKWQIEFVTETQEMTRDFIIFYSIYAFSKTFPGLGQIPGEFPGHIC
jgi:hypothetical protein